MSFSYTDPTDSQKDAIRFLLGDVVEAEHLVEDEEIDWAISRWYPLYGTIEYVASTVADAIASRYAREASYSADGVSVSLGPVGQQYRDLAAALRQQHKSLLVGGLPDVGGISPDEQLVPGVKPFAFGTGMHDDPEVGRQDYGSQNSSYVPENQPGV